MTINTRLKSMGFGHSPLQYLLVHCILLLGKHLRNNINALLLLSVFEILSSRKPLYKYQNTSIEVGMYLRSDHLKLKATLGSILDSSEIQFLVAGCFIFRNYSFFQVTYEQKSANFPSVFYLINCPDVKHNKDI